MKYMFISTVLILCTSLIPATGNRQQNESVKIPIQVVVNDGEMTMRINRAEIEAAKTANERQKVRDSLITEKRLEMERKRLKLAYND